MGTSDGGIVVAWSRDGEVVVQRLDGAGTAQWGSGVVFAVDTGSMYVGDLQPSDSGRAILSFVRWTGGFGSPIHLWAQKLAPAEGASLWDAGHVRVFDGGALHFGNFPGFSSDSSGGAVFSWYTNSPSLDVFAQRTLANGSEAFAHAGVAVSTDASRLRVAPSAAFDPGSSEVYVFWTETNSNPSQGGVCGQRLSAAGARLWTNSGGLVWTPAIVDLATSPTFHSRLEGCVGSGGFLAYTFERGDSASDAGIVAQNLNVDGTLGPGVIFFDGFESGDTLRWSAGVP